jgi:hypothetical protein
VTPDQVATYTVSVMQSTITGETYDMTIDESVAFLDECAKATIKQLKQMRDDIKHSEPWDE